MSKNISIPKYSFLIIEFCFIPILSFCFVRFAEEVKDAIPEVDFRGRVHVHG